MEVRVPNRCSLERVRSFVVAHRSWLENACRRVAAHRAHFSVTSEEERKFRRRAAELLPAKTAYYAARMGVTPTSVKITSAQTRYGSCSAKNGICYSWRVMLLPEDLIDYIVVHELAHIREHNHSPAFYRVIERELPDYKKRVAKLKKI